MTLREQVLRLVEDKGVRKSFIADKICLDLPRFSNFIKGRIEIPKNRRAALESLIDSYYPNK